VLLAARRRRRQKRSVVLFHREAKGVGWVMIATKHATRPMVDAVATVNHLSGLTVDLSLH
jgi:hypothetical protein